MTEAADSRVLTQKETHIHKRATGPFLLGAPLLQQKGPFYFAAQSPIIRRVDRIVDIRAITHISTEPTVPVRTAKNRELI